MPEYLRIWEISQGDKLNEIPKAKLDLEDRLENWLENDISILASDILVIGRQVKTDYGGAIDLLGLDSGGDIIVIELKRDKTPREVTSQALDYASWIKDVSRERVIAIANEYFGNRGNLEQVFKETFGLELPDVLNSQHKIIIVASEIDSSTERIIRYLSETYGVGINAATFDYFREAQGRELIARGFLIEPEQVEQRIIGKKTSKLTYNELEEIANDRGCLDLYKMLYQGLLKHFGTNTSRTTLTFTTTGRQKRAILNLIPIESNSDDGLKFKIYITRLSEYLAIAPETFATFLPKYEPVLQEEWSGLVCQGFFKKTEEVSHFLAKLNQVRSN